ncbi:MAG: serine/threonine protein kinase [Chloroflexi bacterium]|nr:serine/threonine protein kinase [Chloroflexota bacterium]MBP8056508.1 serine/threonine protein kinase [Chloroflexota bacterium]
MRTDPVLGRQFANFRVERVLQRGGMAQVYYGTDVKLRRPVAIKIIDTLYRENPIYARRFIEEARTVATWSHENIIRIYYADDEDDLYYFVMEYIDGSDLGALLADYTRRGEFMPYAEVIRLGRGIAAALDYAHEQGVIHRDVKPSNVMVAKDGRVILMDFGLALSLEGGSIGEAFGTPQYIAPEQANRSADAVPQSDLYSLGVILYELLTGTIPFDDPSAATLVIQHLLHEPPTPSDINPALPESVDRVLLKALRKKPEDRYGSGEALMAALNEALPLRTTDREMPALPPLPAGLTPSPPAVEVAPVPAQSSFRYSTGREKWFNWLLGGVLFGGILALLLITWTYRRGNELTGTEIAAAVASPSAVVATLSPTAPTATRTPFVGPSISTIMPTATSSAVAPINSLATPTWTTTHPNEDSLTVMFTPTSPPILTSGHAIQLFYDETSFYLLNQARPSIMVGLLTFEAIDNRTGVSAAYLFSGRLWSDFFDELEEGNCVRIETVEGPRWMRPPECDDYNATVTPLNESSELVFWLSRSFVSEFRILWLGQEVGRCQTHVGVCQVFLPE